MKKPKWRHNFDRVSGVCLWTWSKRDGFRVNRNDWTIIGISKRWFGPWEYGYFISFFGFEISIWIKREWM